MKKISILILSLVFINFFGCGSGAEKKRTCVSSECQNSSNKQDNTTKNTQKQENKNEPTNISHPEPKQEPNDNKITNKSIGNIDAKKLLALVNDARTNGRYCGTNYMKATNSISWNKLLIQTAKRHSKDMNKNNFFSHTSQTDGSNVAIRAKDAGYDWLVIGENLAYYDPDPSEETIMEGWINSPGHCENIMNPDFKEIGMYKDGIYWTQVFGTHK